MGDAAHGAVPREALAAVRLREAGGAERHASASAAGRPSLPTVHADVADAGHLRDVSEHAPLHVPADGRVHAAAAAAEDDGEVQQRQSGVRVYPQHALGRTGDQSGGRGHGDLLRLGLEPGDGRAGAGPRAPHRADAGRAHLPAGEREHGGGEHPQEGQSEAASEPALAGGGSLHHAVLHPGDDRPRHSRRAARGEPGRSARSEEMRGRSAQRRVVPRTVGRGSGQGAECRRGFQRRAGGAACDGGGLRVGERSGADRRGRRRFGR